MSKNTYDCNPLRQSPHNFWAHDRGLQAEAIVIQFYQKKGYEILRQRYRTPFAEIDLLVRSPRGHLLMIEVKSVNLSSFYATRISKKQRTRLENAALFLEGHFGCLVEVHWAFVSASNEVTIFDDITSVK